MISWVNPYVNPPFKIFFSSRFPAGLSPAEETEAETKASGFYPGFLLFYGRKRALLPPVCASITVLTNGF
jgi:hypothetical protein